MVRVRMDCCCLTVALLSSLALCCNRSKSETAPAPSAVAKIETSTADWRTYTNDRYRLTLKYPPSWEIKTENPMYVVLVPSSQRGWDSDRLEDQPKDPHVRVTFGTWVAESEPKRFPKEISPAILQQWLQDEVHRGDAKDLESLTIGGVPALGVVKTPEGPFEKTVYWRPSDMDSLVRISATATSPYIGDFDGIVRTLRGERATGVVVEPRWGPVVSGVRARLVADRTVYAEGEIPGLAVIIENKSDVRIRFEHGGGKIPVLRHATLWDYDARAKEVERLRVNAGPLEASPFGPSDEGIAPGGNIRLEIVDKETAKIMFSKPDWYRTVAVTSFYTNSDQRWHLTTNYIEIEIGAKGEAD